MAHAVLSAGATLGGDHSDLTTKVLIQIRDEIKSTRDELRDELKTARSDLNTRLDATNARLDTTNAQLKFVAQRQTESDIRLGTELVGVRDAVDRVVDLLRADRTLRHDMDELKERVAVLERKTG